MGQAKKRGSFEQRVTQSRAAEEERQISASLQRERDQAAADAAWELLTEEEKEGIRAKRRERDRIRKSIFGIMGATAFMGAAIYHPPHR
jgi:hypothetical protein